jgi:hypothetical protein
MDAGRAGLTRKVFAWALARFKTKYERFVSRYKERVLQIVGTAVKAGGTAGL